MPRISPWDSRIAGGRPQPRTKTVPLPEMETSITLKEAVDDEAKGPIWDLRDELVFMHVPAKRGEKARKPLPCPGGQVTPSRELFKDVAAALVLQVTPEGEQPFTLLDLIGIARNLPERWLEIKLAIVELTSPADAGADKDSDEGNDDAGATTSSSDAA